MYIDPKFGGAACSRDFTVSN